MRKTNLRLVFLDTSCLEKVPNMNLVRAKVVHDRFVNPAGEVRSWNCDIRYTR